jgi:hypothetical protein
MKARLTFFFVATSFLFLQACTSKSDAEDAALLAAQTKFKAQMQTEANQVIKGKENMKRTLSEVLVQRSNFEIENSTVGDDTAKVVVKVSAVPPVVRQKLMGVIDHVEEWKDTKFNISDALVLVREELKNSSYSPETYIFNLKKNGDWEVSK